MKLSELIKRLQDIHGSSRDDRDVWIELPCGAECARSIKGIYSTTGKGSAMCIIEISE